MAKHYVEGSVIVCLVPGADDADLERRIVDRGGEISLKFAAISVTVVKINPGEEKDWIKWLNAQPEVQVAELNGKVKAC